MTLVIAGTAGLAELLLAVAAGSLVGAAVLVAVGAPNRRPSAGHGGRRPRAGPDSTWPSSRSSAPSAAGPSCTAPRLADGSPRFVKVYARDSRDADLLYRGYRTALLRDAGDEWPTIVTRTRRRARRSAPAARSPGGRRAARTCAGSPRCPTGRWSLAMEDVAGRPLDTLAPDELGAELLDAVWREVAALHARRPRPPARLRRRQHRRRRGRSPSSSISATAEAPAEPRLQAIDRAELLASLAELGRTGTRAVARRRACSPPDDLAAACAYLQPLALSAATRKDASKSLLRTCAASIATATGQDPNRSSGSCGCGRAPS